MSYQKCAFFGLDTLKSMAYSFPELENEEENLDFIGFYALHYEGRNCHEIETYFFNNCCFHFFVSTGIASGLTVIDRLTRLEAAFGVDPGDDAPAIERIEYIENELGIAPQRGSSFEDRLSELESMLGITEYSTNAYTEDKQPDSLSVNHTRVALTSLEHTQIKGYFSIGTYYNKDSLDVNGETYDPTNIFYSSGGSLNGEYASKEEQSYVVYNLNFKYTTLEGVVFRPYSSLSGTEWNNPTIVKIYGDDSLLYEAPNITLDTYDSYRFSINVEGVRNLKIVILGVWREGTGWPGMYSYHPKVCLGDMTLLQ